MPEPSDTFLLVSVGNTRTRFAAANGSQLEPGEVLSNAEIGALVDRIAALAAGSETAQTPRPVFVASVNDPVADQIEAALDKRHIECSRFKRDLPVPIVNSLADDSTVGVDRLLDALGAFHRGQQACVVIDAGTAVTVDFIDGEGTFHGGAIAPGLGLMLKALHQHTAALPETTIDPSLVPPAQPPESEEHQGAPPFGKSTRHAMIVGVVAAVRGMCHHLIDRYAEFYRGYPRVVATGGDAPLLFENDALVEHVVPDLTLIGMHAAVLRLRELDEHDQGGAAGDAD
jgi:type III pantothenate kinase